VIQREPYLVVTHEQRPNKEVYGSVGDAVVLHCQRLLGGTESKTALLAMHPSGTAAYLPMLSALARAGVDVLACSSRYQNGDAGLIMERVLLDLGACLRDARERLGYQRVILLGWSGGGSLSMSYQAQAERPWITTTPAGDPCDLVNADLPVADGVILMAAHRGRHITLTEFLDPAITNEHDPHNRNAEFDIYGPRHQPPFDTAFITTYRQAQIERNRRITFWVKDQLAQLHRSGHSDAEQCFVIHGTMADPRWLDPSLEPNDRQPGMCFLGQPDLVNMAPAGVARFSSLRSWLSQWSYDDARADAATTAADITVPVMIVAHSADDAVPTSHIDAIYNALSHPKKELHIIPGANHYANGPEQRTQLHTAAELVAHWLATHP
jgi:pimeloyl-ACP methyl ester carboxylesterase